MYCSSVRLDSRPLGSEGDPLGLLARNPALKLGKFIKKQDRRQHVRPLTREQVAAVLVVARREFPMHYPILICAFRTGMRMGELLGLAWGDIDFDVNVIEVRRSYSHGRFDTPKSHKSRYVDMSDQLRRTLLEHREALKQRFKGQGMPNSDTTGTSGTRRPERAQQDDQV